MVLALQPEILYRYRRELDSPEMLISSTSVTALLAFESLVDSLEQSRDEVEREVALKLSQLRCSGESGRGSCCSVEHVRRDGLKSRRLAIKLVGNYGTAARLLVACPER
jgi:hypothetical protein